MALAQEIESIQLTAAEKFRRFKVRALVEIKLIARFGAPAVWVRARVLNTNKGGAWCRTDKGKEQFFHWSEVRPPPHDERPPLATLGEIVALRAVPPISRPYLDTEPPKPPVTPPPPPPPPPVRPAAILISRADMNKKPRQRHAHQITAISSMFREQRLKRGWAQSELADALSINGLALTDNQISRIELGRMDPTDDILIAFAEVCSLDLDRVMDARDGATATARPAHVPPVTVIAPPAPAPPPPPAPTPPDSAERFAQFTEELYSIAPPPLDRERRKEWFRCAAKLYQLSES